MPQFVWHHGNEFLHSRYSVRHYGLSPSSFLLTPSGYKAIQIERLFTREHTVDRPGEAIGQHRIADLFAIFCFEPIRHALDLAMAFHEHNGLHQSPLQIRVAELAALQALDLPCGSHTALDQAAVTGKVFRRREALDRVDLVEDRQRQHIADTGNRKQQPQILAHVFLGVGLDRPVDLTDAPIILLDHMRIACNGQLPLLIVMPIHECITPTITVVLSAIDWSQTLHHEAIGAVRKQSAAHPDVFHPATSQHPRRPLLARIDISGRQTVGSQTVSQLLGIFLVVLVLAAAH
jgi:hypothetical protein